MKHTVEASNVKIDVFGKENIPKEDGYIFYPNHQGIFDGFALVYACQKPFSHIIKQELTKVPIVNGIMNTMDPIPMQREGQWEHERWTLPDSRYHVFISRCVARWGYFVPIVSAG